MILLPTRRALVAGVALVLATNAVAIVGVVRNRASIETRFELGVEDLDETPLFHPVDGDESASRDLRLHVRVPSESSALSDEQVRAIGLDPARTACDDIGREHEIFVALEFDGPAAAHERDVDAARRLAHPKDDPPVDRGHLFAIDFDRDAASLRTRHPDTRAVAIARGIVREGQWCSRQEHVAPRDRFVFSRLSRPTVHVPFRLAHGLPDEAFDTGHGWRARIAFGARHEAFVEAVAAP